jgi:Xaa-Pro aminopeptidase
MYSERIHSVLRSFDTHQIEALVVSNVSNIRYLTGFTGSHALLLLTKKRADFFTDARYREQVETQVTSANTHIVKETSLLATLAAVAVKKKPGSLGFEGDHLAYSSFKELQTAVRPLRCRAVSRIVETFRQQKNTEELAAIRKAVRISDDVFLNVLAIIKPGITELDLSAEISYLHKKFGAEGDAFEPIVLSGKRTSLVHGKPSAKKIKRGELVLMDFGCTVNGYCSDMTRTIGIGHVAGPLKKMYASVLEAQREAVSHISATISAADLDRVARSRLKQNAFDKFFAHGLGHGLGLDIHERPFIGPRSADDMAVNNVVTIEPGVYVPGLGGIRIEDTVLVHAHHGEVLTSAPKDFLVV